MNVQFEFFEEYGIIVPPSKEHPPPDLYPVEYRSYTLIRDNSGLFVPFGGITHDRRIYVAGMELFASEHIPEPMGIIKRGSNGKHHLALVRNIESTGDNSKGIAPICGNRINKWKLVLHDFEDGIMVCAKSNFDNGGTWCRLCIDNLRIIFDELSSDRGRATHVLLQPMPEDVDKYILGPGRRSVMVSGIMDDKNYGDPEYKHCIECRRSWHHPHSGNYDYALYTK